MTPRPDALCRHCLLPVGRRGFARTVNGEGCQFCCYGCCIAHQVKSGSGDASEAAWFLVRLGVGSFLSMNIMLFSLLVYSGAFSGADRRVLPTIHLLLWGLATPAVLILGEPFLRETWSQARRGRLTSSALIVLGSLAAYAYSTLAVFHGGGHLYFDTASMVLMLFTLGRYLEAAGRARASRDLAPLLAAESELATVVEGAQEHRRPVREVRAGMLIRVKPGERIPVDGLIVEGRSHTDEAVITGESRQIAKAVGAAVLAGSINLDGPLLIRSSGAGGESRWAQICRSVRDALRQSSRTQRTRRSLGGRIRAHRAGPRGHDPGLLGAAPAARSGDAHRAVGAGGGLSLRSRLGRADGALARYRAIGPAWLPGAQSRRARSAGRHAPDRLRQDRHAHSGPAEARRSCERWRRGGGGTGPTGGSGAAFRAWFGARHRDGRHARVGSIRSSPRMCRSCPGAGCAELSMASPSRPAVRL